MLTSLGKVVKTTASTGLTATRLPNGTTVHHLFGLLDGKFPLEHLQKMICDDDCYRTVTTMILSTYSIVIDEVSMLSRKIFETVEGLCYRTVKTIQKKQQLSVEGLKFILVGDFYQLRSVPNMLYGDFGAVLLLVLSCVGACIHSVKREFL